MRRLVAGLVFAAFMVVGCGGTAEPEAATIVEIEAAVRAAAQALLDAPSFEVTSVYVDRDDPGRILRIDWVSARPNGDRIEVTRNFDRDFADAYVQIGGERWNATSAAGVEQGWQPAGAAHDFPQGLPGIALLVEVALPGGLSAEIPSGPDSSITRQEDGDGSSIWRVSTTGEPGVPALASTWVIDDAGRLVLYRSVLLGLPPGGGLPIGETRHSFSVPARREVALPEPGAQLDLERLGVPDALLDFSG